MRLEPSQPGLRLPAGCPASVLACKPPQAQQPNEFVRMLHAVDDRPELTHFRQ
jgi:hypothetical protein